MGVTPLTCPACAAALKPSRALEPGQRVKCPRCAAVITVPAASAAGQAPESAPRPPPADRRVSPPAEDVSTGADDPKHDRERPRKRRKKAKKKTNPALFWGLIGGGAAAVVLLVVVLLIVIGKNRSGAGGGDAQQAALNKLLAGEWESTGAGKKYTLVLTDAGKVHVRGAFGPVTEFRFAKPLKVMTDFGLQAGTNLDITYRCVSDTRLEIRANYLPLLEKLAAGGTKEPSPEVVEEYTPTETLTYAVTQQELTLTSDEGKSLRLRRGNGLE